MVLNANGKKLMGGKLCKRHRILSNLRIYSRFQPNEIENLESKQKITASLSTFVDCGDRRETEQINQLESLVMG